MLLRLIAFALVVQERSIEQIRHTNDREINYFILPRLYSLQAVMGLFVPGMDKHVKLKLSIVGLVCRSR